MHRKCHSEQSRKLVSESFSAQDIVTFLLSLSHLEYTLKEMFQQLLAEKEQAWTDGREAVVERFNELSQYFQGDKALSKVKRDDNMMRWFINLAEQVRYYIYVSFAAISAQVHCFYSLGKVARHARVKCHGDWS
jgi:WASH complex subunit strumpellin